MLARRRLLRYPDPHMRCGNVSDPTDGRPPVCETRSTDDRQPDPHLHQARRRRRDASRRHEPRLQAAPAGRGLRHRRRAERGDRRCIAAAGLPGGFGVWLRRVQNDLLDVGADLSVPAPSPTTTGSTGAAPAAGRRPSTPSWLEQRLRRGQRARSAAALVRDPGRQPGGGPAARLPHRLPPCRAPDDRGRRGAQPRGACAT